MKQLLQSARSGKLVLADVPEPRVTAGNLLVATRASAISPGTERLLVDFAKKGLLAKAKARPDLVRKVIAKARRDGIGAAVRAAFSRLDEPLPLGYSAAGRIVAVGAGLEGAFRIGERVAIAGAGLANHAELNVVPRALVAPIPDGVDDEDACFATLGAIALHGTRNLSLGLGDVAAVVGVGLIGQIAVQLLAAAGVRVIALDYKPERLALALRLGAERALDLAHGDPTLAVMNLSRGKGADGVLVAASTESSEPLSTAAKIARDRARVSLVGMSGTTFDYREFQKKELTLVVSRSYGPGRYDEDFEGRGVKYPDGFVRWTETDNLSEVLRLMAPSATRRLDIKPLITHRFDFADAQSAYRLLESDTPQLGVVLAYDESTPLPDAVSFPKAAAPATGKAVIGVIGAGQFARSVLLPELKAIRGVVLDTVVTRRASSSAKAAETFGFAQASTDVDAVLANPAINAVIIATRHGEHADLAARALAAGKAVFVEKPLALDRDGLNRIIEARNASKGFFQVGFNRRFAPFSRAVIDRLAQTAGPRVVSIRVNAGSAGEATWVNDPTEGGGRILGEACHFIDLARFIIGAPIVSVSTEAIGQSGTMTEDATITLRFADSSLATIVYTARGDVAVGKERIEAFAGGVSTVIEDFRSLAIAHAGRVKRTTNRATDKGFRAELDAFIGAIVRGGPAPIDEAELIETSLATIAALEAIRSGGRVTLIGDDAQTSETA
ncbi:MAG: theronine dehydrogenase [Rhodospirillales bacterium]|nr:theronine dehydrogenase [Rhodospirillales bacterium]